MNLRLQTAQPEFLAKLLQDVEAFKINVNEFVDDYTDSSVSATVFFTALRIVFARKHSICHGRSVSLLSRVY